MRITLVLNKAETEKLIKAALPNVFPGAVLDIQEIVRKSYNDETTIIVEVTEPLLGVSDDAVMALAGE